MPRNLLIFTRNPFFHSVELRGFAESHLGNTVIDRNQNLSKTFSPGFRIFSCCILPAEEAGVIKIPKKKKMLKLIAIQREHPEASTVINEIKKALKIYVWI